MNDGSGLIRDIMFQLTGVPEPIARHALNMAICELSLTCLIQPVIKVPVQNCVAEVKFKRYVPQGYDVIGIALVKYCDICLEPIDKCSPCPQGYRVDSLSQITLFPAPSQDSKTDLELCLTVQPSEDICEYPDELIVAQKKTLIEGMKHYLMSMPDKVWSNTGLAAFHGRNFQADCASLAVVSERQYNRDICL